MSIASQVSEIYLHEETYQKEKLSKEEADKHHQAMLDAGRLITVAADGQVVGYVEFYLEHGCCFINDLFVRRGYRGSKVIWMLKRRLFEVCHCKVYFGERNKNDSRYPETQLRSLNGK